jgi:hypothetical protein
MFARLLPAALLVAAPPVAAPPVAAQESSGPPRELTGRPDSCTRVVACIGDDGVWFDGRGAGWNEGTLAGQLSTGATCTGSWACTDATTARTVFACDDGTEGAALAVLQDPLTGTPIAEGTTTDGRAIVAWSGEHVLDVLRGPTGEPSLPCIPEGIPIG